MCDHQHSPEKDTFLLNYDAAELRIASEFLSNWLPFLSRGLCNACTQTLTNRVRSLDLGVNGFDISLTGEADGDVETIKKEEEFAVSAIMDLSRSNEEHDDLVGICKNSVDHNDNTDTHSLGSWKSEADGLSEPATESSTTGETSTSLAPLTNMKVKMSWADMAYEDELEGLEEHEVGSKPVNDLVRKVTTIETKLAGLSREQREYFRFCNVRRKKDFICLERVNGKIVNVLDGLELHTGVFSAAEQNRIVKFVKELQEMGRSRQLKDRTYSAPIKWMRGKGRITLQFGCCYNYAMDKKGNPPGILKDGNVDPLPPLFKVMIKRLVRWHVLPPSCVPDSCIVNIYEEEDCIPPHIDNHDFVRPFCTVSFLSECDIVFGTKLGVLGPGDFSGSSSIALPLGSVLVLKGNGADVAKHCVPAVPTRRISITFRKMDECKRPIGYVPEADLQGLEPLPYEVDKSKTYNPSKQRLSSNNQVVGREEKMDRARRSIGHPSNTQRSDRSRQGHANRPKN